MTHALIPAVESHRTRVNLLNTMQLAANLSDTIAREMCHRKSETFAKNYFTFDPS